MKPFFSLDFIIFYHIHQFSINYASCHCFNFKISYSFASNVGGKTKPSSGAAGKQTAKATFTAVHRDYDDNIYMYVDQADIENNESFASVAEFEEKWFSDMSTLIEM